MAFQRKSQPLKSWSRLSSAIWKSTAAYSASVKKVKRFTRVACVLTDSFRLITGCTWRLALESPPKSFSRNGLVLAIRNIIIKLVLCLPVVPSVFLPWKLKFLFIKVINVSVNKTGLLNNSIHSWLPRATLAFTDSCFKWGKTLLFCRFLSLLPDYLELNLLRK